MNSRPGDPGTGRSPSQWVAWVAELAGNDLSAAGTKGANLAVLTRAGLPVPPGFVVLATAYLEAVDAAGIRRQLRTEFARACVDDGDDEARALAARRLAGSVRDVGLPESVRRAVVDAYHQLGPDSVVAVRSAPADAADVDPTLVEQYATFVDVIGEDAVLDRVLDCWAAQFSERLMAARGRLGLVDEPSVAVIVQEQVRADRSGLIFTTDASGAGRNHMLVQAGFGTGESLALGETEPDSYVLTKDGPWVVAARVSRKPAPSDGRPDAAMRHVLTDDEAVELAAYGNRAEAACGDVPQCVEWAGIGDRFFLLQSQPAALAPSDLGLIDPHDLNVG